MNDKCKEIITYFKSSFQRDLFTEYKEPPNIYQDKVMNNDINNKYSYHVISII